jgi:hypothetical protein
MTDGAPSVKVEPGKIYEPVLLTMKFKADADLVLTCQRCGDAPHRGTPIGKIIELWPRDALKRLAISETKTFIRHMKNQGYEAQQAPTEMELWGPYREKMDMRKGGSLVNFEEGNPLIPQGRWGYAAHGVWNHDLEVGPRKLDPKRVRDHRDWKLGVVFLVRGKFLASHGHQEETTGETIV